MPGRVQHCGRNEKEIAFMRKVYKSKIDIALPVLILSGMIAPLVMFVSEQDWIGLGIILGTVLFSGYLFYTTDYTITAGRLRVRSGFLVNKKIDIATIHSVQQTDSLWSAPAGSLTDRIEIVYVNDQKVVISPKEKEDFVKELLKRNPAIEVKL